VGELADITDLRSSLANLERVILLMEVERARVRVRVRVRC
jgi:hypothetical protein